MSNTDSKLPIRAANEVIELAPNSEAAVPAQVNPLVVVHSLLRGRYTLAICLAILGALIGGPMGYFAMAPEYRSVGIIRIEPQGQRIVYKTEESGMMPMFDAYLSSQVAQISSRRLVAEAMQEPDWKAIGRGLLPSEVVEFEKSLQVANPRGTALIQVSFSDRDPRAAAAAVKSVVAVYERFYEATEASKDQDKLSQLDSRQAGFTAKLNQINESIQSIAGDYGATTLQEVFQVRLSNANTVKSQLEVARIQAIVTAAGGATSQPSTQPLRHSLELVLARDEELQRLKWAQNADDREVGRLVERYGDGHPLLTGLRASMQNTDEAIRRRTQELTNLVEAAPVDALTPAAGMTLAQLQASEAALSKLYGDLTTEIASLALKNRQIEKLRAEAAEVQEQLEATKSRIGEVRTERDKAGRLTIISSGDLPLAPDKDRRKALSAVGSIGMAGMGVAFVIMLGFLDRRLRHVDRARSHLPQVGRLLGVLPDLPTDLADSSEAAESAFCVHHIRAMVQIHQRSSGRKVFAITSPSPGDGKTSLTIALAMSMASSGSNTLVVDCDFDGGGLTSRLGAISEKNPGGDRNASHQAPGLVDVLRGMPLEQAIASTGFPNLSKLTLGAVPGAHSGQVSPGQLRRILIPLAAQFDIVLVDCGPILGSIEAAITAAEVDSVILVVSRESDRVAAEHAANLLIAAGSAIEGIVFNRARPDDVAKSAYHSSTGVRSTRSSRHPSSDPAAWQPDPTVDQPSGPSTT